MGKWKLVLLEKAIKLVGRQGNVQSIEAMGIMAERLLAGEPKLFCQLCLNLSTVEPWPIRYYVSKNLPRFYWVNKSAVTKVIKKLAEAPEVFVRDGVLWGMSRLAAEDFEDTYPLLLELLSDPIPQVRRLAPFALVSVLESKSLSKKHQEFCFQIIENSLANPHIHGSKQLGAYIIGKIMANSYPEVTIQAVQDWMELPHPLSRWHLTRALSCKLGELYPEKAQVILAKLAKDPDQKVRQGAKGAILKWKGSR